MSTETTYRPRRDGEVPAAPAGDSTRLGLSVLAAALGLGLLGDALLRALPWGLNVVLWIGALVAASVVLARRHGIALAGEGRWLVLPVLFFAATIAWRDSLTLGFLNLLALLVGLALLAHRARAGEIRVAGVLNYVGAGLEAGMSAAFGMLFVLLQTIRWRDIPLGGWTGHGLAVGRGLVIAIPLTLVFGGLFATADAAFAGIVGRLFGLNLDELFAHAFVALVLAWIVGGYFLRLLIDARGDDPTGGRRRWGILGMVEAGVILGLLNALFLTFVVVQFRYLFGGEALVEVSPTLTYAQYARRGFFELVGVATLLLPVLLVADWVVRREGPAHERLFRVLAGALVLMMFVIMASAVQRMRLYQEEFGLTELRLYTTAFMAWLAAVFVWFLATVLRGRSERFAFGALVAVFAMLGLLNALNPDEMIVRTNAGRAPAEQRFDGAYATSLSADAVPALVEALPAMPDAERGRVAARVLRRWTPPDSPDWRTWNWGRSRAWQAVADNREMLESVATSSR